MPKQFDLLIFDWDGTLMDSAGVIADSIQRACEDIGQPAPSDRASRQIIGLGLIQALQTLLPDLSADDYPRLVERYRHHYLSRDDQIPLFDGVADGIRELHECGFQLAVATGKSRLGLSRALDASGLGPWFAATRCADQTHSKPHPAMVLELLDELDAESAHALVIGDTSHDLLMASNAGVASLGVTYGAHEAGDLHPHAPLALMSSFAEVHAWLNANA
ncbi:MAG: HAD family hydrolase [Thiobacillus sp. 63-78]|uniref:HAD-IA family hydrolase n=1 Tax=Thiobacillus sp. 63-78 TaxID=1895859 RepID=UPI0009692498|nr:HAD-IA family hydrolase [Thiobacillus sp. 63-78]MBN8764096.1 HAD-IA family hydrolase [Thiobacillus sp.]MBN8774901.1 HAD-IA family hydrolase [Thiobacillus sp.]OJZ16536.1 MAG: HAD family hydrolase [Thiobacillus sp. 63-78]